MSSDAELDIILLIHVAHIMNQRYDIDIHGISRRPMNHFGGFGGIHFHKDGSTTGTRVALSCVSINQSVTQSSCKAWLHRNYWRQKWKPDRKNPNSRRYVGVFWCSIGMTSIEFSIEIRPFTRLVALLSCSLCRAAIPVTTAWAGRDRSRNPSAAPLVVVVELLVPLKFNFRICVAGWKTIEV